MSVEYDVASSDHRPLTFELAATVINNNSGVNGSINYDVVTVNDWDACSNYATGVDTLLRNTTMPPLCYVNNCTDRDP